MESTTLCLLASLSLLALATAEWNPTERNMDEKCSEQAAMAQPKHYCELYLICCGNELKHSLCLDTEPQCEKVDASHQKQCLGRNCTELTTTTTTTAATDLTSAAAVALPSALFSLAFSVLLATVLGRRE